MTGVFGIHEHYFNATKARDRLRANADPQAVAKSLWGVVYNQPSQGGRLTETQGFVQANGCFYFNQ